MCMHTNTPFFNIANTSILHILLFLCKHYVQKDNEIRWELLLYYGKHLCNEVLVTLYFTVSWLQMLHALIIVITVNYALLHATNPKPNPNHNPHSIVSSTCC